MKKGTPYVILHTSVKVCGIKSLTSVSFGKRNIVGEHICQENYTTGGKMKDEKEERILIGKDIESPCVKCKVEFCAETCEEYDKFAEEFIPSALKVYSRKEAIEKMAKAICWEREHYPFEDLPQYEIDFYIKQAKAALKALLEK